MQEYPLSGWTNEGVPLQTDWTTGEFPSVTLVDGGTADRLRKTSISGVTAGDHVLSYSITSTKTRNHYAQVKFEKAGNEVSQQLPDTHGSDPIRISLINGTAVGTVNIRLSDVPDEVHITVIDPGGGGASTTTLNYLDIALSSLTETQVISEPDGWKDAVLKLERHPDFHSLVEYFEGSFVFYGENNVDNGGADFIRQTELTYGASAEIGITITADIDGDGVYEETIFIGQLDLTELKEVFDNKIRVPIIRTDLWAKFIARLAVPVDMRSTTDMDGNVIEAADIVDLNLTSQKVRKEFDGYLLDTRTFFEDEIPTTDYIQLDVDTYNISEIDEKYTLPIIDNPEIPASIIDVEEDGEYTFDLRVEASIVYYDPAGTYPACSMDRTVTGSGAYMDLYIQINDETPIQFSEESSPLIFSDVSTIYTYTGTRSLQKGDQIKIYGDIVADISALGVAGATLWIHSKNGIGSVEVPDTVADPGLEVCTFLPATEPSNISIAAPSGQEFPTRFNIVAYTTYPNTTAQGFLIHDAADAIIKRIIGPDGVFRSEYLGATETLAHQYSSDGCAWKNVILQGLQLRGYDIGDKRFSLSFEKLWKCIKPLFCLGLGYDTYHGTSCIIIDELGAFYDKSDISVRLSNVRQISREYDTSMLYNQVETGFSKWQSEDISGIDDVQTKRRWSFVPSKHTKLLSLVSDAITASIAIEVTRRKTIEKSEDYKFDNEPFIIAINGAGVSPDRYVPELDENFTSITGLQQSDTRYNSIHTPMRMLLRWAKVWNGCLQKYQNSIVKFISGEGNYDMQSDYDCSGGDPCLAVLCDNLSEKTDLNLSTYGQNLGFHHLPLLYTIEIIDFTWDDYLSIRNNRNRAIGISQTLDNYKRFFIKELSYDVCKGKAKLIAWPYDETAIEIVETEQPGEDSGGDDEEIVFDPDYQAVLDYGTLQGYTLPSDDQQIVENQKMLDMKSEGVWNECDLLYHTETDGDRNFAKINWRSPGTYNLVENGTLIFTPLQGFTGNVTDGYLDTGWNPEDDAVHFTLDEGGAFIKINNETTSANIYAFGISEVSNQSIALNPKSGTSHRFGINSSTVLVSGAGSSVGLFHIRRVADNDLRLFKDGIQVGSVSTQASTSLAGAPATLVLLAFNGAGIVGAFSNAQVGVFGIGASMTGKEVALNTIFNT